MIYAILIITILVCSYADYPVAGGLALLTLAGYTCYRVIRWLVGLFKKPAQPEAPKIVIKCGEPSYHTKIAGVQYRCDHQDVGGFLGYIQHDPTNSHDPNAIAIYRNDGKHLGYIPKDETNVLRSWSAKAQLPCVGFIKEGDEVPLFGKVKVLDTFPEEAELEVAKYVRWMVSQFGLGFVPEGFAMDPAPTSKKQALEIIDEYIENKEAEIYEEDSDE
jgi:hypothetical protein